MGGITSAGYWDYATQSNTPPGSDPLDVSGNNACHDANHSTVVGEFQDSESAYGTFDQSGNLWEFLETLSSWWREVSPPPDDHHVGYTMDYTTYPMRGGGCGSISTLSAGHPTEYFMTAYKDVVGPNIPCYGGASELSFRVVQAAPVPESSSILALLGGLAGLLALKRRH